jgi:tripartite-type tricarboxylate transporter receptor subunit TctC
MMRTFLAFVVATALAAPFTPAFAQSSLEFYKGKEVRIIVGYAAGGGYDAYARAAGQVLGKHLPGNPTVIVQNMPGADGLAVANYMAKLAPRDGTVIGLTNRNLAVAPLLGMIEASSVQYDPKLFNWIANLNSELSVLLVRSDLGIRTIDDLRARELAVGSTGQTSNNAIYPYVINNVLGTRLKVVTGYPGTSHLTLALERGEIGGVGGWAWSSIQVQRPDWIKSKFVLPLLVLGTAQNDDLKDWPHILDFAHDDDERRALELVFAPDDTGRPFFAPPATPAVAVDLLRAAFAATVGDQDFKTSAEKARLEVTFTSGAVLQEQVIRLTSATPAVIEKAKHLMRKSGSSTQP